MESVVYLGSRYVPGLRYLSSKSGKICHFIYGYDMSIPTIIDQIEDQLRIYIHWMPTDLVIKHIYCIRELEKRTTISWTITKFVMDSIMVDADRYVNHLLNN